MPAEPQHNEPTVSNLYRVVPDQGRFAVKAPAGPVVLVCDSESSAEHYAVLLGEAFMSGYKYARRKMRS